MSALQKAPAVPKQFDLAKLESMIEPLNVRVEKLRNGHRTPMPLPESEEAPGHPGGTAYDKDAIKSLEQFLVTEWSGGGIYHITVVDSAGQKMEWTPSWPVGDYPERVPPPLQTAANPTPTSAPATRRTNMPAFPQGFPSFFSQTGYPQQQPQQGFNQQQPYPYAYPPLPPPPPVGTPGYQMWSQEADKRSESAELKQLREDNARRERERLEEKHRGELERERQATAMQFAKQETAMTDLRNMIKDLATTFQTSMANAQASAATAQTANKPSPELEAMRLQLAASEKRAEDDRREREARDTRDMIKQMGEQSQKQIEAMQRQLEAFQASLASANTTRQDPMIEMLREQARQSTEAIKEVARGHASQMDKIQTAMLNPRDILQLAKESSQAADQVTDKLTNAFSRMIDLQSKATESVLQLQPQGNPVVDLVRDGAANLQGMAERFFGGKELQQKLEATRHEQMVHAQRDIEIAKIHASNGLSGVQTPDGHVVYEADGTGKPRKRKPVDMNQPAAVPPGQRVKKILGKTEQEWFGPIYSNVLELRKGVAIFLLALKNDEQNPDGTLPGINPEQAAKGIAAATAMIIAEGVSIAITDDLLFQHRYSDFMDVMIPNAPEQYKSDVINLLLPLLRGEVGGGASMTGEPKDESTGADDQGDADEATGDDPDDDDAGGDTDGDPDDGDDSAQDGAESPVARGPALAVVKDVTPKNGKPVINPPRRA